MKFIYTLLCSLFLSLLQGFAQGKNHYDTYINNFKKNYNSLQYAQVYQQMSDRIHTLMQEDKCVEIMSKLHGELGDLQEFEYQSHEGTMAVYKLVFERKVMYLKASLDVNNNFDIFNFSPDVQPNDAPVSGAISDFIVVHGSRKIVCVQYAPKSQSLDNVVLFIGNISPMERSEHNAVGMRGSTYALLADSLQRVGITFVRFNKVLDTANQQDQYTHFDSLVSDVRYVVQQLQLQDHIKHLTIVGHGTGALVAALVAQQTHLKHCILLAPNFMPYDKVFTKIVLEHDAHLQSPLTHILDSLKKGLQPQNIPNELKSVVASPKIDFVLSMAKYVPKQIFKQLTMPTLFVLGNADPLFDKTILNELRKTKLPSTFIVINKMDHYLKMVTAPTSIHEAQHMDHPHPEYTLYKGLPSIISQFLP